LRTFGFYDFSGIIVPGAVGIFGAYYANPALESLLHGRSLSAGDIGFFIILAYAAGHIVQAIGVGIEYLFWKLLGGKPSHWNKLKNSHLLSGGQRMELEKALESHLGLKEIRNGADYRYDEWDNLVREIYIILRNSDQASRIDIFQGNYGLNRGMCAAFILVFVMILFGPNNDHLLAYFLPLALSIVFLLRMYQFAKYYARELFLEYIQFYKMRKGVKSTNDCC